MLRAVAALASLPLLAGCVIAPAISGVDGVDILTPEAAASCTPLVRLTTTTGVSGEIGREEALQIARNQTLADALGRGANAVVFVTGGPDDPDAFFVEAQAYRC